MVTILLLLLLFAVKDSVFDFDSESDFDLDFALRPLGIDSCIKWQQMVYILYSLFFIYSNFQLSPRLLLFVWAYIYLSFCFSYFADGNGFYIFCFTICTPSSCLLHQVLNLLLDSVFSFPKSSFPFACSADLTVVYFFHMLSIYLA